MPEGDTQTSEAGEPEQTQPLINLEVEQARQREIELEERLAATEAQLSEIRGHLAAPKDQRAVKADEDADDEYGDDPAIKRLSGVEASQKQIVSAMNAISESVTSIRSEIASAKDDRVRAEMGVAVDTWTDQIIASDPVLSKNTKAAALLKKQTALWASRAFNPAGNHLKQISKLKTEVENWRQEWTPAFARGDATPEESVRPTKGAAPDKRAEALRRDEIARTNNAVSGSAPPTVEEETRPSTGAELFAEYMKEAEAAGIA